MGKAVDITPKRVALRAHLRIASEIVLITCVSKTKTHVTLSLLFYMLLVSTKSKF